MPILEGFLKGLLSFFLWLSEGILVLFLRISEGMAMFFLKRTFLRDFYPLLRGLGVACYAKVFAVGGSVTIKTCKNDGRRQVLHTPFNFSKKFLGVCRL